MLSRTRNPRIRGIPACVFWALDAHVSVIPATWRKGTQDSLLFSHMLRPERPPEADFDQDAPLGFRTESIRICFELGNHITRNREPLSQCPTMEASPCPGRNASLSDLVL